MTKFINIIIFLAILFICYTIISEYYNYKIYVNNNITEINDFFIKYNNPNKKSKLYDKYISLSDEDKKFIFDLYKYNKVLDKKPSFPKIFNSIKVYCFYYVIVVLLLTQNPLNALQSFKTNVLVQTANRVF